ncbi:hypothetical protein [Streptomyces sp. NRRL F-2580]|uniref:hypothetical protein n=1 Tax=Streptomyces sp. NRRL F-2580 TaxID=1463841 RepID=UPI0004C8BAA6|nr:hypothetical protein [Streptomyces sp. NRRL F-2580]
MATAKKTTTAAKSAEAKDQDTAFEFKGEQFLIKSPMNLPDEVLDVIEEGAGERAITRAIVGPEQWAKYRALRCTIGEFNEFLEKVTEAAGFGEPGN